MKDFVKTRMILIFLLLAIFPMAVLPQPKTITGVVTDESGEPVIAASVGVLGTTRGTMTDNSGRFSLMVAAGDQLRISCVGFVTVNVAVGDQATLNITMVILDTKIEDIVVVGYGTVRKQDITGAVGTISSKEIRNHPANNFQEVLIGRAAGVEASLSSGKPGDVASVRIRGIGTVNTTSPLYIVDGVPLNRTVDIDPRSIESISILKDASATAIYGSRGSNGVIIITTKKGKAGKIDVDFDSYIGFKTLVIKHRQASSAQLYDFYLETNRNDGTVADQLVKNQYDKGYNTDWLDLGTQTGFIQSHGLSISGGTDKMTSSLNVSYMDELGAMKKNNLKKITVRNSNEFKPSEWIKFGNTIGAGYYMIESSLATLDVLLSADPFTPPVNPLADPADPNYYYNKYAPTEFSYNTNPLSLLSQSNSTLSEFNPFGSIYGELKIIDGLFFKSQAAFEKKNLNSQTFEPYYRLTPSSDDVAYNSQKFRDINRLTEGSESQLYLNFEQTLRFERIFGRHSFNTVAGLTYESWTDETMSGSRTNIPSNDPIYWTLDSGTGTDDVASGRYVPRSMVSYLGRVNYSFDQRYMVTASFRSDGSSEFSEGNRWGYFPSFSLGWDVSREPFFERLNSNRAITQFKVRAGWGATGNMSAANRNQTTSLIATATSVTYGFGTDKMAAPLIGVYPKTRGNSALKWETANQYNLGLDMALFRNSLEITLDLYKKYTNDMILTMDLPVYAQYVTAPKVNMGKMLSNGMELTVSYNNSINGFYYGVSGNISMFRSIVRSLGGNPEYWSGDVSRSVINEEFGRFYVLEYLGIFQDQREIDMYVNEEGRMIQPLAKPGDFKFADRNGDGQITDADRDFFGTPQSKATFGLNLTASYRNFDLTAFFSGVVGNQIFNYPKAFYGKLQKNNILQDLYYNSWRTPGEETKYPRITSTDLNNNFRYSSWYLEDGSYIKMRNLQLGYTFTPDMLDRIKVIQGLRIYVMAQNLFTITRYTGFDPEVGFNGIEDPRRYIPPRIYMSGFSIKF